MPQAEPHDIRLKRLKMRSMRRGIKEMDLLLMAYAEHRLASLSEAELDTYEALLDENDQDLYAWVSGKDAPPARLSDMLDDVARNYRDRIFAARGSR
ncbi:MAG: succinate dehydrogenase assembly factor 2 [Pseudomonadota bacterium]